MRKKRKKQKEEAENISGGNATASKRKKRDFSNDLHEYLEEWTEREGGTWKFNKNLQTYALDNCLDIKRIDSPLFNKLVPYINSVVGISRNRLLDHCQGKVEEYEGKDDEEKDKNGDELVTAIARANLLLKMLAA